MNLSNVEIAKRFKKYVNLKYNPLGMYFSKELPQGKIRIQGKVINRCIVKHVFNAAKRGGISILKDQGCPGGQFWAGFRKKIISGWAYFISKGKEGVMGGRAERYKKDTRVAVESVRNPGPIHLPEGVKYIIYRPLKDIPNEQNIEFILFYIFPKDMAKLITLINYARYLPNVVRAPSGSGCMSILNYPLQMKEKPEPDAVMGIWDLFSRTTIPKHILTLTIRKWFAEDMALDIPESFLGHTPPFTFKGEIGRLFKKIKKHSP